MVEDLPSLLEAMGSIPSTGRRKKKKYIRLYTMLPVLYNKKEKKDIKALHRFAYDYIIRKLEEEYPRNYKSRCSMERTRSPG